METAKLQKILNLIDEFAASNPQILAVGLCGSWARGNPGADSDIDLSIIVEDKARFKTHDWIKELDFSKINEKLDYFKDEVYGRVWSRHVFLQSKIEIEFSFADKSWADSENPDQGTIKVVSDGYKIIHDPQLILHKLVEKIMDS